MKKCLYSRRMIINTVRLIAFMVFCQLILISVAINASSAAVEDILWAIGDRMMRYPHAINQDKPRTIFLNGLSLKLSTGITLTSVDRVLDLMYQRCRERNGRLADQIDELIRSESNIKYKNIYPFIDGILRFGSKQHGFIACIDVGKQIVEPKELIHRIQRFLSNGRLVEIGELRYMMAKHKGGKTHFVSFWTEGDVNLLEMFPVGGDAPGRDIINIPRPPNSHRLLSAWESEYAPSMTTYSTNALNPSGLSTFYRKSLLKNDWIVADSKSKNSNREKVDFLAEKQGRILLLSFYSDADNTAYVTICEMN